MSYALEYPVAAYARPTERATFIRRTYLHVAGAVLAFVGVEALIMSWIGATHEAHEKVFRFFMGTPVSWLFVVGAFIGVGALARYWARNGASPALQYLGLGLYVVAQAIIFVPLLLIARYYTGDPLLIEKAGVLTLFAFGGLTGAAFITRKDFSFLGPILMIGGFLALGLIVVATFFSGLSLGLWFGFFLVALASAGILYDTSNIIHHYSTNMHVAAALALFASLATMFYYILWILIQLNSQRR
jgi:FtsH-binding integral membrane protein